MKHWTTSYHELVEAKKVNLTMKEVERKLDYVRNLTDSKWSHEWKALAVGVGKKIECSDGVIHVHLCNSETYFVALPVGSAMIKKVEELNTQKFPTWPLKFAEIKKWDEQAN